MSERFSNKVAIVTGASRGIGAATARRFAAAGAAVVLAARTSDALEKLACEIEENGGRAIAIPTDITDERQVDNLIAGAIDRFGRVDVAFNNAGDAGTFMPLVEMSAQDFEGALRVNALGTFLCVKHEVRSMQTSGGGAIVNMSSTGGLSGVPGIAGYIAGKHAVIGLTKTAALEYARDNIRINAVAPGPILTERLRKAGQEDRLRSVIPLGRAGQPEEVADLVLWLCSDEASFITGTTIAIDGGKLAGAARLS